jgi:hypothetical protein
MKIANKNSDEVQILFAKILSNSYRLIYNNLLCNTFYLHASGLCDINVLHQYWDSSDLCYSIL